MDWVLVGLILWGIYVYRSTPRRGADAHLEYDPLEDEIEWNPYDPSSPIFDVDNVRGIKSTD